MTHQYLHRLQDNRVCVVVGHWVISACDIDDIHIKILNDNFEVVRLGTNFGRGWGIV